MKWLQKGLLPPTVKEMMVSKVGSYQAEKLTATLLNGTLAQKAEIIQDLELEDHLRVCYNCGKLITEGYMEENDSSTYCSKECAIADIGEEYINSHIVDEEGKNGSIFWTSLEEG